MNYKQSLFCFFFVFLLTGCSEPQQDNKITIQFWADNQQLGCKDNERLANSKFKIEQLGLYLSNLTLLNSGTTMPLQLAKNPWQTEAVALMYLSSDCQQSHNQTLTFDTDFDKKLPQTLTFNVGVPFELNHQNPLSQASPLNLPSMFWAWQNGHKFLRLDLITTDKPFSFHLGSVGCASSSRVRAPESPCAEPNFFSFKLDKQQQGEVLKVNLDKLLDGIDVGPENSCLFHGEQEPACLLLIENLRTNQVFEWL
ncbi:MAG: putative repeat protein (TIGR04052 family) [Paraglaciecola sp.]|jgi:uncharacterized repeat protein (TIGR04052 family)